MKYGKGKCGECGRSVLTREGRAVEHPAPGATYQCDGVGERVVQTPAAAGVKIAVAKTPAPRAAPAPPPIPAAASKNALRASPAERVPVSRRQAAAAKSAPAAPVERPSARPAKTPEPAPDENAFRLDALRRELDEGASVADAVAAVNGTVGRGSIDFEALAKCDCPSLAAAVRAFLRKNQ